MIELTRRGLAGSAAVIGLLFAAVVFRDFAVEVALLIALVVMVAEATWVVLVTRKPQTKFELVRAGSAKAPDGIVLYPGQESLQQVSLTKKVGGTIALGSRINFLQITPALVRGTGTSSLELRFATQYAGDYTGSAFDATVSGPLGLFSSTTEIPFVMKYTVYPRLLQVAARTVRLLAVGEIGETPIDMPGVGSEFYDMRRYLPGDDVRNVNWKASAREGDLMVVEHMREVGSHILLVLDARAQGFNETDRLASTFLTVANSLWGSGIEFSVFVHDGARVTEFSTEENQRRSLRSALHAAVSFARLGTSPEFLELVPARTSRETRFDLGSRGLFADLAEVQSLESRQALLSTDPWTSMAEYVRGSQTRSIVYVSALSGNVQPVVELAWESRHYRNVEFVAANPCDNRSSHAKYLKQARGITAVGARYVSGEPADLARSVLTV